MGILSLHERTISIPERVRIMMMRLVVDAVPQGWRKQVQSPEQQLQATLQVLVSNDRVVTQLVGEEGKTTKTMPDNQRANGIQEGTGRELNGRVSTADNHQVNYYEPKLARRRGERFGRQQRPKSLNIFSL